MNNIIVRSGRKAAMPQRRDFLRKSLLLAVPLAAAGLPISWAGASALARPAYNPPPRARGTHGIDVRDFGARGDGSHDDTTAFQNAIDALASGGGTVHVPAGRYVIDPVRKVYLRSRMHLKLAAGAKLIAKGNSSERAYVLMVYKVSDVEISGGEIEGDRNRRQGTAGQWGHGIMVRGSSRVTIRNILITKCWGDGICVGGAMVTGRPAIASYDVVVANVACVGNRRAGLTIGRSRRVRVYDSEFSDTSGIAPGCGINIEPDDDGTGAAEVHIESCLIRNNQQNGIQIYKHTEGVTVRLNTIENNLGYGILAIGAKGGFIALNHIRSNELIGVGIRSGSSNYQVSENRFYNNARRYRSFDTAYLSPPSARVGLVLPRHIEVTSTSRDVRVTTNYYYDA